MTLNICVLASGSTGNSTVIWNDQEGILIDCGRSKGFIEESLFSINLDISKIKGILITHGHGDHMSSGAINLSRFYKIPIYIHRDTLNLVESKNDCRNLSKLDSEMIKHHTDDTFSIGEIEIKPFRSSHKGGYAGKTFGFCFKHESQKIGFLTDTGKIDDKMINSLINCDALVLEANHDPELVEQSDRSRINKDWILGDFGHLSNIDNASAIIEIKKRSDKTNSLKHIFIAHLSELHNNTEIATTQIKNKLKDHNISDIEILPTYHRSKSMILQLK